jgi:hypothetical protein
MGWIILTNETRQLTRQPHRSWIIIAKSNTLLKTATLKGLEFNIALKTMFESMMILVIDANLFFNSLPAAFFYFIYKLVYIFLRS